MTKQPSRTKISVLPIGDRALIAGPGTVLELLGGVEEGLDAAPQDAVQAALLVAEAALAVVVAPERDRLREVGIVVALAEVVRDAVDGQPPPRPRRACSSFSLIEITHSEPGDISPASSKAHYSQEKESPHQPSTFPTS